MVGAWSNTHNLRVWVNREGGKKEGREGGREGGRWEGRREVAVSPI